MTLIQVTDLIPSHNLRQTSNAPHATGQKCALGHSQHRLHGDPLRIVFLLFSRLFMSIKMQKWSNDVLGAHATAIEGIPKG